MRLCTAADVKARKKSLPNVAAIDATVEDAIDAATPFLEGKLRTFFEKASLTLTYRIDTVENPTTGNMSELFLDRGLVDLGITPTVKTALLIEELDTGTELTLGKEFHVKADDGIILLDTVGILRFGEGLTVSGGGHFHSGFSGHHGFHGHHHEYFARVTYTAGLESATPPQFDNVPEWLKEAAVVSSIIILEQQSKVTKTEFGDQLTPKNQTAWHHLRAILNRRGRFFGAAIKPLF